MAQVTDLFGGEGALRGPQFELGMPQPLEDNAEPSEVLIPSGREDNNVIEVKEARFPMEAGQDLIHEAGKGGRSVAETKGNLVELKQLPAAGSKRSFLFVLLCYRHLPISTFQVQSREPFGPMESIQEVIYPGQRVCILDGSCV